MSDRTTLPPCPNCAQRPRLRFNTFCGECMAEKAGMPLRTARELFEAAGHESMLIEEYPGTALVVVGGKGGTCIMLSDEWHEYRRICALWFEGPKDMDGADPFGAALFFHPGLTDDQDAAQRVPTEDLRRIIEACRKRMGEVRALVESVNTTLSVEDYGDALTGALRGLAEVEKCHADLAAKLASPPDRKAGAAA